MMIKMKTTWEEVIGRSSDMSWPTLGRDDGDMLQSIVMIIIDFECDSFDEDDGDDDEDDDDKNPKLYGLSGSWGVPLLLRDDLVDQI